MLARLQTFSLVGIEAVPVDVEVDVSGGALPATVLVGMPDAAIRESTHRVARAIVNSGFTRPNDRIVVNLAPAALPKQAATFDLPITLGILFGSGQFSSDRLLDYAVIGELSLEGSTRPARGALSIAIAAARQKHDQSRGGRPLKGLVVPAASAMAPPEPPSPVIVQIIGEPSVKQRSVDRAIASAWPRSSPPTPG